MLLSISSIEKLVLAVHIAASLREIDVSSTKALVISVAETEPKFLQ